MTQTIRCLAPGCRSFGNAEAGLDVYAVHPAFSEYTEVPLCALCAGDARDIGVQTVKLLEARALIRRHEVVVMREEFFRQFISKELPNDASAAA